MSYVLIGRFGIYPRGHLKEGPSKRVIEQERVSVGERPSRGVETGQIWDQRREMLGLGPDVSHSQIHFFDTSAVRAKFGSKITDAVLENCEDFADLQLYAVAYSPPMPVHIHVGKRNKLSFQVTPSGIHSLYGTHGAKGATLFGISHRFLEWNFMERLDYVLGVESVDDALHFQEDDDEKMDQEEDVRIQQVSADYSPIMREIGEHLQEQMLRVVMAPHGRAVLADFFEQQKERISTKFVFKLLYILIPKLLSVTGARLDVKMTTTSVAGTQKLQTCLIGPNPSASFFSHTRSRK